MKISFCTTCMGRTPHLKQTLLPNIRDNLASLERGDADFIVLDYSSTDGLSEWMLTDKELLSYRRAGLLKYAQYEGADFFNYAHAKNMVHRLGEGDVLCNVDADNFIGKNFASFALKAFTKDKNIILRPKMKTLAQCGCAGRIAISRDNFFKLRGYEEMGFSGWAGEDTALVYRSIGLGLKLNSIIDPSFLKFIEHSDVLRLKNLSETDAKQAKGFMYTHSNIFSSTIRRNKLRLSFAFSLPVIANNNRSWGTGRVFLEGREVYLEDTLAKNEPKQRAPVKLANYFSIMKTEFTNWRQTGFRCDPHIP